MSSFRRARVHPSFSANATCVMPAGATSSSRRISPGRNGFFYTGRLHRLHPAKKEVRIFDYVDRDVTMLLRMFEKRLRGFRAIGYTSREAPPGYGAPADEVVLEYEDDLPRDEP